MKTRILATQTLAGLALLSGGCAVTPDLLTEEDLRTRMRADLAAITAGNEPIEGPLDLYAAMARALQYNLDFQLELRRTKLAERELELARWEMLPKLVTNIGWNKRNNYQAASSISYITGAESLEPSYSQDRDIFSADLGLTWNVLDFGLSYVRAKQGADKVLVAREQRREVVHRIMQDVRVAYWRAVSAERLLTHADALEERVSSALADSREAGVRKLTSPLTALTYERELIGIKRELQRLERELSFSKIQLAALVNARPGEGFELVIPASTKLARREIGMELAQMEQTALANRPEVKRLAYEERINAAEAKAALLQLLPGLEIHVGANYNNNSLLVNRDWISYGARITHGLVKAFALPKTLGKIEAEEELLYAQRLSLTMAVLTQVHVAHALFEHHEQEFQTAVDYRDAQARILEQVRSSKQASRMSEQALIREEMNALVAEAKHDIAYADLESSYAAAFVAMGLDPLPEMAETQDIADLAAVIGNHWDRP